MYWTQNFCKDRDVFIIYKESIEPWLFACKGLISSGCTIALQDDQLASKSKLVNILKEERQALTYLLIATSSFALLF